MMSLETFMMGERSLKLVMLIWKSWLNMHLGSTN